MTDPANIPEPEPVDVQLATAALTKRARGETPTLRELEAMRRVEKLREQKLRWQYYRTVPKGDYEALSGRQDKILLDQAERYGFPLQGRVLDLSVVLKSFHDFIAANAQQLGANKRDGVFGSVRMEQASLKLRMGLVEEALLVGRVVPFDAISADHMELAAGIGRALAMVRLVLGATADDVLRPIMEELELQEQRWKRRWGENIAVMETATARAQKAEARVRELEAMMTREAVPDAAPADEAGPQSEQGSQAEGGGV